MSASANILLIEDDPLLAGSLRQQLSHQGHQVTLEQDGQQGLSLALTQPFDLVLMDILLPGCSGLEVLAHLRRQHNVPVVLMSALGAENDRIAGFSAGADDYLPKPFSMAELNVRIEALLRRIAYERNQPLQTTPTDPQLICCESAQDVRITDQWAGLTATEYRLLEWLLRHANEVQSKAFLYQQVLHRPFLKHDRVLDMHISHVRRKLQQIGYEAGQLETVWGTGYALSRKTL